VPHRVRTLYFYLQTDTAGIQSHITADGQSVSQSVSRSVYLGFEPLTGIRGLTLVLRNVSFLLVVGRPS